MINRSVCCFLLLLILRTTASGMVKIVPTDPDIRYTGRWNFDNPLIPWVGWQGSSIMVTFEGRGISVEMAGSDTEQYRVIIDGVAETSRRYITSARKSYVIAEGLTEGTHTMELFKETFYGTSYFYGLEVDGKGLVPLSERPALRIEFFGDSNMDGSSNYSEKNSGDMGTYYAFPAMVTRMFGAEMNNQSVSGAKLHGTGDNCVGSFIFSEDYYHQDPDYRSEFDPHIIVVNAGANDIGDSNKPQIKQKYKDVVADLRSVYGDLPQIILMNSYGWDTSEPAIYTHEVVDELDDPKLSVCLFPWLWEQWHGSQWDHSGQAYILLDHITELNPEWMQKNQGDIIDGFGRNLDFSNGSFEHAAPFGAFGWRYLEDGVERIHDPEHAADGAYYIRLGEGNEVHQPVDATGDFLPGATLGGESYYITAKIRGKSEGAQAQIAVDFQGQQIWKRGNELTNSFLVTTNWETYTAHFTAPAGKWTLFTSLRSVSGEVEFDSVCMSNLAPGGVTSDTSLDKPGYEGTISPNPVSGESVLSFNNSRNQQVTVQIFSFSGALLKVFSTRSDRVFLSSGEFGQGFYLYKILARKDHRYMGGTFIVN